MTYKQIFSEIYNKNKYLIRFYLCLSLFVSIFLFYTGGGASIANATALSDSEGAVLGGSFTSLLLIASSNANISISPPIALSISAGLSIWCEYGTPPEQLQNFSFGLVDIWPFRIFVFVWAIVSILPRCTQITRIGGLVLEDVDQKMGQVACFIVPFSQILATFNGSNVALAATQTSVSGMEVGHTILNILLCFLLLVVLQICSVFIKTFMYFLDILQIPICTLVPFTSVLSEIVKVICVIIMYALAIFAPGVYFVIYGILLLLSILFFKKAYVAVRYFKNIYVKPLFKKIIGYDANIPLHHPRAPKGLLQKINTSDLRMLIPVYSVQNTPLYPYVKKHDRWWLAVHSDGCYLYKHSLFKKQLQHIKLINVPNNRIYLKNSLRFFEIFSLADDKNVGKTFGKLNKQWNFVYSKEYFHRFQDILQITGFTDYALYAAEKKPNKGEKKGWFSRNKQAQM